ncbi:MAG: hypothetical protein N2C14_05550 [Planctomycetales bacterium]
MGAYPGTAETELQDLPGTETMITQSKIGRTAFLTLLLFSAPL